MTDDPSLRAVLRGPRGTLLVAMLLAEFAVSVDLLGYAAVLPIAARELGGEALYSAAITASQVLQITCMAFGALLHGRLGPAGQLWIATAVWTLGASMTALAPSMAWVVAGMATRGIASGLVAGLGIGVLSGLYEGPRERERAIGLFGLMWVLPSLVAPALNASLLAVAGWRITLAWPIVLLVAARVLVGTRMRLVARPEAPARRPSGAGWLLCLALLLASTQAAIGAGGWAIALAPLLAVAAAWPLRAALRTLAPTARTVRAHAWTLVLAAAGYFGTMALVPLLASRTDASGATGAVLVAIAPLAWTTLQSTGLTTTWPTRLVARLAALGVAASTAMLAATMLASAAPTWVRVLLLGGTVVAAGLAMGVVYGRLLGGAFHGFEETAGATRAHAAVGLTVAEIAGSVLGTSVLAGVVGSALVSWQGWAAALVLCVGIVLTALWLRAASSLGA